MSVVREIESVVEGAKWVRADVSKYADLEAPASRIRGRSGRVNLLVNNAAASGGEGRPQDVEPERAREVFEVCIAGVCNGTHVVADALRRTALDGDSLLF